MPLVIDRRFSSHLIFGTLLVAWVVVSTFVLTVYWHDRTGNASPFAWITLVLAGGFLAGVLGYLAGTYGRRLVFRAEFGDDFRSRTLFGEHCVAWSSVGRFVLKELATPFPAHCLLKVVLTDGRRLEVWASRQQGAAAFDHVRHANLACAWPGLPLGRGTAGALLGLGTIALAFGGWLGYFLVQQLNAPGPAPDFAALLHLIPAVVAVPLLGVAGTAFGGYHLVRAPLVIQGGLFRIKEGERGGTAESVRNLFGTYE